MEFRELVDRSSQMEVTYHVTPEIYYSFQRVSNDYNPLHTDEAFARSKGFLQKVMYGNILNAFVSHFVGMALPSRDVMILTQDIQFRKPVYMHDELLLKSQAEAVESVEIINYKLKFYKMGGAEISQLVATGHVQVGMLHEKKKEL